MCGRPPVCKVWVADYGAGSIASMCPASHEGIRVKLFHRGLLHVYSSWLRISLQSKAELSSQAGHFPANLTSGGTTSPPRSRIRDGRAPGERQPLCETAAYAPGRTTATPPWIRVPVPLNGAGSIREVNQDTGFITAPSGTLPWVTNRHKAIRSRRAIATTMTLRMRFPVPPTRSRNQMT